MVWVVVERGLEVEASLKDKGRNTIKIIQNNQTPGEGTSSETSSTVPLVIKEIGEGEG